MSCWVLYVGCLKVMQNRSDFSRPNQFHFIYLIFILSIFISLFINMHILNTYLSLKNKIKMKNKDRMKLIRTTDVTSIRHGVEIPHLAP